MVALGGLLVSLFSALPAPPRTGTKHTSLDVWVIHQLLPNARGQEELTFLTIYDTGTRHRQRLRETCKWNTASARSYRSHRSGETRTRRDLLQDVRVPEED